VRHRIAWLLCVASLLLAVPVAGQQGPIELELNRAKALYQDGQLEEAVTALRAVIARLNQERELGDRTRRLADAHFHLGLAQLAMRDDSSAIDSFRQVAVLDPDRALDPDIYAPKVLEAFEQARADVAAARAAEREAEVPTSPRGEPPAAVATPPTLVRDDRPLTVVPGTKMRVRRSDTGREIQGQFIGVDERAVTLGTEQWRVEIPLEVVDQVHVVRAQKAHWLEGLGLGAACGAVIGAFETPGCSGGECYTQAENIVYDAIAAGLIGALIGALYRTDVWVDVSVRQPMLARSRPALQLSVTWRW